MRCQVTCTIVHNYTNKRSPTPFCATFCRAALYPTDIDQSELRSLEMERSGKKGEEGGEKEEGGEGGRDKAGVGQEGEGGEGEGGEIEGEGEGEEDDSLAQSTEDEVGKLLRSTLRDLESALEVYTCIRHAVQCIIISTTDLKFRVLQSGSTVRHSCCTVYYIYLNNRVLQSDSTVRHSCCTVYYIYLNNRVLQS